MNECKYSEICGGCQLQSLSYKEQLKKKENYISSLLSKFGKISPIIGMENPLNYRNKVQVTFGYDEKHRVICGNYAPNSHYIIDIDDCMLCDEVSNRIIRSIKRLVVKYKISVFDERAMKGCIRHVLIRTSNLNEVMVVLVTGSLKINKGELFLNDLLKFNPEITTVVQNFNRDHTSMILGKKSVKLYGKGYIEDRLCGFDFKISPASFYQINKRQTEVLYNTAIKCATFNGSENCIDAYCGTGTIGMIVSKHVKYVHGVEINESAVKDAVKNAKRNKIDNIEFVCADAGKYMVDLAKKNVKIDTVIMDPPRAGSDINFMKSVCRLSPKQILYISCGPESLKDNLGYFVKNGYSIKKIRPVDMFPFTGHVETIVLLSRTSNKAV